MLILFPADTSVRGQVDSAFEDERAVARSVGHKTALVDDDLFFPHLPEEGLGQTALYRGWMLTPARYAEMYGRLWGCGYGLINTPEEYRYAHELPQWYDDFKGMTPQSLWFEQTFEQQLDGAPFDLDALAIDVREKLGEGPYVLKDYVKSKKHEWSTKCFIPTPGDIKPVAAAFLKDGPPQGGLVVRKYVPFDEVGMHAKSGIPLHNEVRFFILNGAVLSSFRYWSAEEGANMIARPSDDAVQAFLQGQARSNFYTMDLARVDNTPGQGPHWLLIELGDGQVAGLPPHSDAKGFYAGLKRRYP